VLQNSPADANDRRVDASFVIGSVRKGCSTECGASASVANSGCPHNCKRIVDDQQNHWSLRGLWEGGRRRSPASGETCCRPFVPDLMSDIQAIDFTAPLTGIPFCEPSLRHFNAAASHPISKDFCNGTVSLTMDANAPTKASPAPVVSTGVMQAAGARRQLPSAVKASAPCAPAVTMQLRLPVLASSAAAAS
jgi:hypothetical protein